MVYVCMYVDEDNILNIVSLANHLLNYVFVLVLFYFLVF